MVKDDYYASYDLIKYENVFKDLISEANALYKLMIENDALTDRFNTIKEHEYIQAKLKEKAGGFLSRVKEPAPNKPIKALRYRFIIELRFELQRIVDVFTRQLPSLERFGGMVHEITNVNICMTSDTLYVSCNVYTLITENLIATHTTKLIRENDRLEKAIEFYEKRYKESNK